MKIFAKIQIIANKISCIFLLFMILFSFSYTEKALETWEVSYDLKEVDNENIDIDEIQKEVIETSTNVEELKLDSRIALIYDRASGRILYEKNGNKQTPMASTTNVTDT